MSENYLLL